VDPDSFVESCLRCVKHASAAAAAAPNPLSEFVASYVARGRTRSLTCGVIRCHSRTLRRLTVPLFAAGGAAELERAVSECRVLEALDISQTTISLSSWAHLGSTLHTLSVHIPAVTFRMLAEHMPALRVLCMYMNQHVAHDGFVDVVSRLRSLEMHLYFVASWCVTDWPATFPYLEELVWKSGKEEDMGAAVEIISRAPSLRSASVPHVAALAAVQEGSLGCIDVPPALLLHVRALTLTDVAEDGAALVQILAAAPAVSSLTLRCASDDTLWRALDAALALVEGASGDGVSSRVRRLRLDTDRRGFDDETRRHVADRVVRLFPRLRVALYGNIMGHIMGRVCDNESLTTIFPLD
jgi:hypothetical protein